MCVSIYIYKHIYTRSCCLNHLEDIVGSRCHSLGLQAVDQDTLVASRRLPYCNQLQRHNERSSGEKYEPCKWKTFIQITFKIIVIYGL